MKDTARVISPEIYQALAIAGGLEFYVRTGKRVNRAYTPVAMMATATRITGKKFAPRDYVGAAKALRDWATKEAIGDREIV